jgi:hypothetical protein
MSSASLPASLASKPLDASEQYTPLMDEIWKHVAEQWKAVGKHLAGEKGYKAIHLQSVRLAHPPLPIFMYLLGCVVLSSNGAQVVLFGSLAPVAIWILNVNYSQTRKSGLTGLTEKVAVRVDARSREMLNKICAAKAMKKAALSKKSTPKDGKDTDESEDVADVSTEAVDFNPKSYTGPLPGVWSSAFTGGTIDRCKERCSCDFNQVKEAKMFNALPGLVDAEIEKVISWYNEDKSEEYKVQKLSKQFYAIATDPGLKGRMAMTQGLLYDEVYDFLQELAILDTPSVVNCKKGQSDIGSASGQTPNAGWANKFIQHGKSEHETKTQGCFGNSDSVPVSSAFMGNFHCKPAVEMAKGLRGDHGCQTKARFHLVTGKPIQPHEMYDSVDDIAAKSEWCPITPILVSIMSLNEEVASLAAAAKYFGDHEADLENDVMSDQEDLQFVDGFFPCKAGWEYALPDGVMTKIRMRETVTGFQPEWLLANRDIDVPDEYDIEKAADRLILLFGMSNRTIDFTKEAKLTFLSYQAYFNMMVARCRKNGDVDGGASHGTMPWKLGMLSAALMLWDIQWGQASVVAGSGDETIEITTDVVTRAFGLLELLASIQMMMAKNENAATSEFSKSTNGPPPETPEPDFDFIPKAGVAENDNGIIKDSDIARRILSRMKELEGQPGQWSVHKNEVFKLLQKAERQRDVKFSSALFLSVARQCPGKVGKVNGDVLEVTMPDGEDAEFDAHLLKFANMSRARLLACLSAKSADKRGAAGRASRATKKQKTALTGAGAEDKGNEVDDE